PLHYLPIFFLLTHRPPAAPTLFPYTTLFRSEGRHVALIVAIRLGKLRADELTLALDDRRVDEHEERDDGEQERPVCGDREPGGEDRKSTRLNSSHVKISYAVFCLKKKKQEKH